MSEMPAPAEQQASETAETTQPQLPSSTNGLPPTNGSTEIPAAFATAGTLDPAQNTMFQVPATMMPITEQVLEQQSLSADDIALYDRQIRLWGIKAQEQLRAANVLLVGMKALGNEVAKNLVLAGIGSLTVLDHEAVTEDDLGAQFFITESDVGRNRAEAALPQLQKLNPRVQLFTDPGDVSMKAPEYFAAYDVTIVVGGAIDVASTINASCRIYGRKFYAAGSHGMYGYVFADLIQHNFIIEREKGNIAPKLGPEPSSTTRAIVSVTEKRDSNKITEVIVKSELYSPLILANSSPLPSAIVNNRRSLMKVPPLLSCFRALFEFQRISGGRLPSHQRTDLEIFTKLVNEKHLELQLPMLTLSAEVLRKFIQSLGSELSPVVAYLGGNLAQDVINVLGQREQPLQNFLIFNGEDFSGPVYSLHPIFDESLLEMDQTGMMNGTTYADTTSNWMDMGTNTLNGQGSGVAQHNL